MTLADSTPDQSTLAESLSLPRHAESAWPLNPGESAATCNFTVNQIVKQIGSPKAREIVGTIFGDLLRLLECLHPIESQLNEVDDAEGTFALFQFIHDEACTLVKFIREEALTCEALDEELCDTLDGITFAVSHDLQRVFETRLPGATEEASRRVVVGRLFRAHDVLTDCLQQATLSLASVFDAEIVGTKLFNNSEMRYRQSIQLCEDLSTLLKLFETCEETTGEPTFAKLTAGIEKFRIESLECLRYSDCPQFEGFCERIQLAATPQELEPVVHQFRCYVETLLGQVRMRAVLANVFPIEFGGDDLEQSLSSAQNSLAQSYSRIDFEDDSITRDILAIAG
jgi:hypothetical protein